MAQVVNDRLVTCDESPDGSQRLGEGPGDDVDLLGQAEVGRGAVPVRTDHTDGVGVVEGQGR